VVVAVVVVAPVVFSAGVSPSARSRGLGGDATSDTGVLLGERKRN
jgi:hypothetical protein